MFGRDHTDQRFAHYCRTGDPDALADVFDRTAGRLMRVALWLVGNRPDAEDLLQRTFLQAIEARASFELGRPVLPWLLGLLGNQARKLRSERQRATVVSAPADRVVDAVAEAAAKELEHAVGAVRDRLGAPYSEVLRLHLEEGLNGKEIAERLARPAGTVRTQLVRALEQLRRHLPGGFVAGLAALVVVDGAAIAAVRVGVLAAARAVPAPVPVGGLAITTATIGGLLMAKKFLLAVPLVLLLLGSVVWNVLRESPSESSPESGAVVVSAEVGAGAQEPKQPLALVSDAAPERAPALPPATSGEPGFAALHVLVRRAQDKAPVVGTWVHANYAGGSMLGHREALTDDAGVARFDHLSPGSYYVAGSLLKSDLAVTLGDGELRTLELLATEVSFVAGHVVDADGRPVAGARLWLSKRSNWSSGGEVGRSDAAGAFRVGLSGFQYLGAEADGHVPSLMQQFVAAPGQSFENVELKLRGTAAGLQGLVVDIRGQPVPWATVLVGPPGGGVTNSGNMNFIQPNPERRLTGRDGRFVATGLPVGDVPLNVWAVGFGPLRQQIVTTAGRTESITVTLVDGAMVAGVVRDSAGKPVVKATVRFGDEFFSFPSCSTTTDEAGRFRLENLPAAPESASLVATDGKASARASLLLTAGATTEWNPVLGTGKTIRGIVLGPGEVPLPGTKVGVVHPNFQRVQRWFDAGADGTFLLQQVGDEPCSVQVALGESVLREVRKVAPDTADLTIRLGARDLPTAHLRGRIVDANGVAPEGSVSLLRDRVFSGAQVQIDPATGAFAFGPMPAGRYRISAWTKATGPLPLGSVELQPEEERELADFVVQAGGELDFMVTDLEGKPVDTTQIGLHTALGDEIGGGVLERGKGKVGGVAARALSGRDLPGT
jgi:RNA polymerase sigma-70 factor (ECF subfamily)